MELHRILSETFVASGEYHEVLGSTNDRGRDCATEGLPLPRLIVAQRQTAGRGRGSNRWWTGKGSLAMSLVLPAELIGENARQSVLVSLAAGVAVVETVGPIVEQSCRPGRDPAENDCRVATRPTRLGLHWPNDVMLDGRKLAGILIEALPSRVHVVGIGINTNNTAADAPDGLREGVVTLRDVSGAVCDHVELVVGLLQRLELRLRQLRTGAEDVARRSNELCLQRGRTLTIHTGEQRITGRCQGIGLDGALLIDVSDGVRACYSGVVEEG